MIWTRIILILLLVSTGGYLFAEREVQYLGFSVKNQFDFYVRDLKREEVELKLNGNPIEIGFIGSSDIDTATVILLENSPRTATTPFSSRRHGPINLIDKIRYQMSYEFFGPLSRLGPILLGQFFRRVEVLQDFSSLEDVLINALYDLKPNFSAIDMDFTRVGHALGRGVDMLRERPERRKVLIVFAASIDRDTYTNLDEYREMFQLTNIEFYGITNAPRFASGTGYTFEEKMSGYFLRQLTSETSGHAYVIKEFAYYDELFTDLIGRLTNTYTIGFYVEPSSEPQEHRIDLKVARPKSKVNCRKSLIF